MQQIRKQFGVGLAVIGLLMLLPLQLAKANTQSAPNALARTTVSQSPIAKELGDGAVPVLHMDATDPFNLKALSSPHYYYMDCAILYTALYVAISQGNGSNEQLAMAGLELLDC
jgi:hypothetical protein